MKPVFHSKFKNSINEIRLTRVFLLATLFLLISIKMSGQTVTVDFSVSPTSVCSGSTVTFTDNSTGTTDLTTYSWDFGAGASPAIATGSGPHIVTYTGSGASTVSLTIQEMGIDYINTKLNYITVNVVPAAPTVVVTDNCDGTSTLITTADGSLLWSTLETVSSITVTAPGVYTVTATLNGCTSLPGSGTATPKISPASPVESIDCDLGNGDAIISVASPVGPGLEYRLDNGAYQPGTSFSKVDNGSHIITVRNASGCTVTGTSFDVTCDCGNVAVVTLSSLSGSTCGVEPVTVSGNTFGGSATWVTISDNGNGSLSPTFSTNSPFTFTYTPDNDDAGHTVIITVRSNNPRGGPCVPAVETYTLTVNANPSVQVGIITQPTCFVSTGSVVLNGLPATGTWTLTRSDGVTTTGNGTSRTVSDLPTGTHTFRVTSNAGCVSPSSANVVIAAQPSIPTPPGVGAITHPTCFLSTGSVILNGLPASGTWTIMRTPGGVTTTGTGTSRTVSGLLTGTYTFTVTSSAGCVSGSSANVIIDPQPLISTAPLVGNLTLPTCFVSTGSVVLNGLPATGAWILTRYPGIVTLAGSGTSITLTDLAAGTYNYAVTNSEGCLSAPSANVVIPVQPVTPTPPTVGTITMPSCFLATGSVVLSGLPASGTWTLTRGPDGVLSTGIGTSRTITGLPVGTYTFTVTSAAGCISEASSNVLIPVQPGIPTVIITNPAAVCSPLRLDLTTAAITLGSTPDLTFTYWTNAAATIAYPTPSTAAAGIYYIKGTTSFGCFDIKPVTVTVNPLPTANAGTGGNKCDLNFIFNAVASIGTGTWTQTTGTGTATFAPNANTPTATVTVSEFGTYTFSWTEVSGTCFNSSTITVNFFQQPVAIAGTGGINCGNAFNLNASHNFGTGTWTRVSGPGSATFTPNANTANALVTVNALGSYTLRWTAVNGTCSNSATVTINFIQQIPANAGTGGNKCDKEFILDAVATTGAVGTWTKFSGPGNAAFTPDNHQRNAKVSVDQSGAYDFAWTVVNANCSSIDIVRVIFHDLPALNAGIDKAICKGDNIQLQADGTGLFSWVPAALVSNPNIPAPVAFPVTMTTFTVTLTDQFGCKNSDDVIVETREKPIANAGTDQVLEKLAETIMEAQLANANETGVWSVISGSGKFFDATNANTSVSGLSKNENIFLWTITNGACPASSDTVMILVQDFIIPTLITPNMDGRNDYFVLNGNKPLSKTELVIFDRRGAQVYKNMNYNNNWDGVDYNNNPLPDDTYFFFLKTESGNSYKGYIVIRR